ncbi:hypothetical protein [Ignavibacterium album]|uniref:hypothetical protein n=1 Tax=Ignavibacterium album TaxID=591197 RepID=UPI0026EADC29|nr:hypothetical protein [Ignavibacterium album]
MTSNLLTIVSLMIRQQLLAKIVFEGKQLEEISKVTGISKNKLVKIVDGNCQSITISELSTLLEYFEFKIASIIAFVEHKNSFSFEFQIDENRFSLN